MNPEGKTARLKLVGERERLGLCPNCGSARWWNLGGFVEPPWICELCHPPANPEQAVRGGPQDVLARNRKMLT